MANAACCVVHGVAWCSGGWSSVIYEFRNMYSWAGPGSTWVTRPHLPNGMFGHSMIYDGAHRAIWALSAYDDTSVYTYSLNSELWKTELPLPQAQLGAQSVLCGTHIITLGEQTSILHGQTSSSRTSITLITDTNTGQTIISNNTLQTPFHGHVVARVIPTY